jgi:putative inorganic carbon (hco3(-)) transporter
LSSSIENWLGVIVGAVVLFVILPGQRRYFVLGYLALILALSFVPFQLEPGGKPVTYAGNTAALLGGQIPHNAPINATLAVIRAYPILGAGPGRFGGTVAYITHSPIYQEYHVKLPTALTSIDLYWLHIWGETGIIGLGLLIWLMFLSERTILTAFRKGTHGRWNGISAGVFAIVIAFSLATFFDNALEVDALSAPFWALVGIAIALPIANRPPITESLPVVRFSADDEVEDDPGGSVGSNGSRGNGTASAVGGYEESSKGVRS